ncbi:MAG TPA: 5-dehydro-2-deoxygluconokinase [Nitrososphaerales archaeon]|nr:5-dehydro-2-deoxygluconokinase [Nitrososphaerales archaeon]
MTDVLALGRAGVDFYSLDYGEPLERASRFAKYVGGTTANVVVGGARLGLDCALVTRVGDDELGRFIVNYLTAEGVDTSNVRLDPRRKNGIVFGEVTPGKDSKFIFYRENAADLFLTQRDVPKRAIERTRVLLFTATALLKDPSRSATLRAASTARALGKTVVFNLDWRPALWSMPVRSRVRLYSEAIRNSDVLVGNDGEYAAATGVEGLERSLGAIKGLEEKVAVVTQGARGSTVVERGKRAFAQGFEVRLLKGLGGGDGFLSGFLFGSLRGWGLRASALFGNACGAIVVTGHACSESMPRLPQVVSFLKERGYHFDRSSGPSKD